MNLQKVNGKPIKSGNIRFLTRSETLRDHSSTTVAQMELKLAARLVYDVLLMIMQKNRFSILCPHARFSQARSHIQYLVHFKMYISKLELCVHNSDFQQVIISFSVIKQQISNDV